MKEKSLEMTLIDLKWENAQKTSNYCYFFMTDKFLLYQSISIITSNLYAAIVLVRFKAIILFFKLNMYLTYKFWK